jgi:hypothetical protein
VKRGKAGKNWSMRAIIATKSKRKIISFSIHHLSRYFYFFVYAYYFLSLNTLLHTYVYLHTHINLQSANIIKYLSNNSKNIKERHFLGCFGHIIKSIYALPFLISTCFCVFLGYAPLGESKGWESFTSSSDFYDAQQ